MASQPAIEPIKSICPLLENGWGNIILELMVAHYLAQKLTKDSKPVIVRGIVSKLFMRGYTMLYLDEHKAAGLPKPDNIDAILPYIRFEPAIINGLQLFSRHRRFDLVYQFHHGVPNMVLLEAHNQILLRADWMGTNVNILVPELLLKEYPWAEVFKPADVIQSYINKRYLEPLGSLSGIAGLHIRVQQPNGDDTGPGERKQPTTKWFCEALRRLGSLRHLFIIVAMATMCPECTEYVDTIIFTIKNELPDLTIHILANELYYVDFFLLASLPNLIISSSTFPWVASVLGSLSGITSRVIVPPQFVSEFGPMVTRFPGFEMLPDSGDTRFMLRKPIIRPLI